MSFSVDQFMQVKCKFQLTSETDSSESIHLNNEKIRLCTSVDLDKHSTLIVLVCGNETSNNYIVIYYVERRSQVSLTTKPRVIVKQIYYHNYNEDIATICLSETGNKLALVSASSTIYILPIKNILLNLHAKQLRSSQGKSMYFYDASILNCCDIDDPVAVAYWESVENHNQSTVIVASRKGIIVFMSVEDKKKISSTNVGERIHNIKIIRDRYGTSLLITCESMKQYRLILELLKHQDGTPDIKISPPSRYNNTNNNDDYVHLDRESLPTWNKKPALIRLQSDSSIQAGALQRTFVSSGRFSGQATNLLSSLNTREKPIQLILYPSMNLLSIIDVLGSQKVPSTSNKDLTSNEPRLLRFFSSRNYYYRPQKPILVCKLYCLEPDEMINQVVLTDRFLAIATDKDRCLINSRNCCNLKHSNQSMDLDPLVKEITFNNEEKIMLLLKSPVANDQDNIIDSFLLVTTRSIYTIEARHTCRDMFVNLMDSHLGITATRVRSTFPIHQQPSSPNYQECFSIEEYNHERKDSDSTLMITSFLFNRDEVYERIVYDSKAFSTLFKLELCSLYEAYGDRLLVRGQYDLANRFFQMAKFDHLKIVGKYIRFGAYHQTINYVTRILNDDHQFLDENERLEMARAGFECLLAKTVIERGKVCLFNARLPKSKYKVLMEYLESKSSATTIQNPISPNKTDQFDSTKRPMAVHQIRQDPYRLCDHSPRGQEAKLSANTIVVDLAQNDDDEETMTANGMRDRKVGRDQRLECEKSLIEFVKNLIPIPLYPYVLCRLVTFDMIDLADSIAKSNLHISEMIKILFKAKDEKRAIFREAKYQNVLDKLNSSSREKLAKIDGSKPQFLQFITSIEVTKALVRDISLASGYLGYQKSFIQFQKYSYTALRQFEAFKELVNYERDADGSSINGSLEDSKKFTDQHKQIIESIFLEFLNACLNESTDDSCRLWSNYINFYLNNIGSVNELEQDILRLLDQTNCDCRIAITLYKAISKDEDEFNEESRTDTRLEEMDNFYNLSRVFNNEFLLKLLGKTLDLVPQSDNLNALSDCLGVDGLMGSVPLPLENTWRQILKTIQTAALSSQHRGELIGDNRVLDI